GLPALLLPNTASAFVPPALTARTIEAALLAAAGKPLATGAGVTTLLSRALGAQWFSGLKMMACLILGAVVIAGGGMMARETLISATAESAIEDSSPQRSGDHESKTIAEMRERLRFDDFGDPLPEGAIGRIGTLRFRPGGEIAAMALAADRPV